MKLLFTKSAKHKVTNPKTLLSLTAVLVSSVSFSQERAKDTTKVTDLKEVTVSAVRAKDKNPITFTNVSEEEIESKNLGQDIPILLNYLPSVVTTTDAGNGVGYTAMRVRGSDGSRINVTLNGIPFNDSESQGSFFVDLPDFASSLESVQLQRGVGTSTNGAGAFGASLNMQTKSYQEKAHAEIANSVGSFGTQKHTLSFGTGLHGNFEMNGRISQIESDGYVDRGSSNMFGYLFNANYVKENTLIKLIAFGGKEKTYQAWWGQDTAAMEGLRATNPNFDFGRKFNVSGIMMNDNGEITGYYNDQTDNYWQNHFQLHWTEKWTEKWTSNTALHYTKGKGYYEEYIDNYYYSNILFEDDSYLSFFGLDDITVNGNTISSMNYIRKRWLDNDFFGATFSANYKTAKTDILLGGAANRYLGKHYGDVVWTQYEIPDLGRYYSNYGNKDDVNFYAKASQQFNKLNVFIDLQYRYVGYQATSYKFADVNDTFHFFNPKVGLNYQLNTKNAFYGFAGVANKEPRRSDYEDENIKPERLYDFELGWKHNSSKFKLSANGFFMYYLDQLVMTGALSDTGSPIFTNSGKSYRLGAEVESVVKITDKFNVQANATLSDNRNIDFYFQRDGELKNLGNTTIAFSPKIVSAGALNYLPLQNLQLSLLGKYVGKQYMGNIDSEASALKAYGTLDFNAVYEWKINKGLKSIVFTALINNLLNSKYSSNGYFYTYDDDWSNPGSVSTIEGTGYYPQAGINGLVGVTLKF
ncbi:TonB-dependent receptor [Flavobacterium sp. NRK F10]|uniref:TonB-dependent receptor n=1 Tax=Flavobacterium sp. NRK F10 TaxID=2954931 RepID=UPI002090B070|nr:TonB-dependent receptor [Flavobacterium sp. NRK F10]MCO6175085.1 TonB-dependent receptor [Flavobacterium sp. NRK F10]